MKRFFILSLPRSGTAWLSNFLTYGSSFCYHELSHGCGSFEDFHAAFRRAESPVVGTADTAGILYAHAIKQYFPGAKVVIVMRDPNEVTRSLEAIGFPGQHEWVMSLTSRLHQVVESLDALIVPFPRLFRLNAQRQIWDHIGIPDPFPWRRFELLREFRVEDHERFLSVDKVDPGAVERFQQLIGGLPRASETARAV